MGRNARKEKKRSECLAVALGNMPDMAGHAKPPCFLCGRESVGWFFYEGRYERVCLEHIISLSVVCSAIGSVIALLRKEKGAPDK